MGVPAKARPAAALRALGGFALFIGLPLLALAVRDRLFAFLLLWSVALLAHRAGGRGLRAEWNVAGFRAGWKPVLLRAALAAPLLAALAWALLGKDALFALPRGNPALWAAILCLYPLLSVWPQEIVYRQFLLRLTGPKHFIAASALAFGWLHAILLNPVAILLTAAGGALFARTYGASRSLALACFEHALYGCLIFTVGLGRFFFTGAAWH
jgi:hypothetical protein